MRKLTIAAITAILATPLLAVAPAEAAKRSKANVAKRVQTADTYYYQGIGSYPLYDRARPYFGSPVRGREFFDAVGTRSPQN